jgi:aspartyl-tRNA(Asn)/glutamyl-tRNA(Gln) amidotransferase subunit A
MNEEFSYATIAELATLVETKSVSPVDVTKASIARAETLEPNLNAFITPTFERALEGATRAQEQIAKGHYHGPLHGVGFGLKDIYEVAGLPTTAHSKILADHVSSISASTHRNLEQAGGLLMGKLATHEFAHGGPSFDLPWPPARNPWNLDHVTGGSSSGSAAAVAAGLMPLALGSDTGGSIRGPAGLCGLVGLKPTYGLVSRYGVIANSYSYDHAGPLTRTVEDAAIALQVLAGFDPLDPASANTRVPDYRAGLSGDIRGLRIGLIRHFFTEDQVVSDEVSRAMEAAEEVFVKLGAIVEDVRLRPLPIYQDIKVTQAEPEVFSIHQANLRARMGDFGDDFIGRVLPACLLNATDYLAASRERRRVVDEMASIYDRYDVLLTVGPGPAPTFDAWRVLEFWSKGSITAPFNVTGGPALVQCMGFTEKGLPMSLQLAGRPFDDVTVLRAAHAYEKATQWLKRRPPVDEATRSPLPDAPQHAVAEIPQSERDEIALICARAGLKPSPEHFEQLCATAPYVKARAARVSGAREWHEEPSNVFRNI